MLATEILKGQGVGNQLFCYITVRSIATDRGLDFGIKDSSGWAGSYTDMENDYNDNGFYWMDIDMGSSVPDNMQIYYENDIRLKIDTCQHDMTHGCDIRTYDENLPNVPDNSLMFGIMQDEKYFIHNKNLIRDWLKVKKEYDIYEYSSDDICILNFRGKPYVGFDELYLPREYWINAINNMLKVNSNMKFVIITDDVESANNMLPEFPAYHFDVGTDYAIIKNAKHIVVSNSSFSYFPVFTSETLKTIIAPKYWARHNVSDGYWASAQNMYFGWNYQDRYGNIQSYDECLLEFKNYSKIKKLYGTY